MAIKVSKTESKPESKKLIEVAPLVPSTKKSNPFGFTHYESDKKKEDKKKEDLVGKVNPFGGLGLVDNDAADIRKGRGRPPKNEPIVDNTRKRDLKFSSKAESKGYGSKPVQPEFAIPESKPKKF